MTVGATPITADATFDLVRRVLVPPGFYAQRDVVVEAVGGQEAISSGKTIACALKMLRFYASRSEGKPEDDVLSQGLQATAMILSTTYILWDRAFRKWMENVSMKLFHAEGGEKTNELIGLSAKLRNDYEKLDESLAEKIKALDSAAKNQILNYKNSSSLRDAR